MKALLAIRPPLIVALCGVLLLMYTWLGLLILAFGLMDARGRYKDYQYLSQFPYITHRLSRFYGKSYCGRSVILAIQPSRYRYYRKHGYRWYYFLPDNFLYVIRRPMFYRALVMGHRA